MKPSSAGHPLPGYPSLPVFGRGGPKLFAVAAVSPLRPDAKFSAFHPKAVSPGVAAERVTATIPGAFALTAAVLMRWKAHFVLLFSSNARREREVHVRNRLGRPNSRAFASG